MRIGHRLRSGLYFACTLGEAIAVLTARRFRRLAGRRSQPDHRAHFLRVFLFSAIGRQAPIRVTCAERSDGAGAQAHTIMSAMCFARAKGHTYVHTPFTEIDHAEQPLPTWVDAWERLFNLGDGELRADSTMGRIYNYSSFHPHLYYALTGGFRSIGKSPASADEHASGRQRHFHPYFYYTDSHPQSLQAIVPDLRRKYWKDKPQPDGAELTVALHMRRGDVTSRNSLRYTSIESVLRTMETVKSVLAETGSPYSMRVYSQGPVETFAPLRDVGVQLCLDRDALWTMHQLITADVLIMSKSSFSYVAALISQSIKLYEPFWHPPLDDWLIVGSRGGIDARDFQRRLTRLLRRRQAN